MKKFVFVILVLPFLISCNQQKVKELESRNDSLIQQTNLKDQSINEFLQSFNDIQSNLDSIKAKEMIISEKTEGKPELKQSAKNQINDDINSIYLLLKDNQDKLSELRKKLGKANYHIQELQKMVDHLTQQLQDKDTEIESMRKELEQMNIKVTNLTQNVNELTEQNNEKETLIKDQTEVINDKNLALNTAYYAVGSKKTLKDNNIITSEGGFIGIGTNKKLKPDFNQDYFTKIDIRETGQIPIPGKKAQVVTNHPTDSYKISGEGDSRVLEILNKSEFWKSSKYLVVIID